MSYIKFVNQVQGRNECYLVKENDKNCLINTFSCRQTYMPQSNVKTFEVMHLNSSNCPISSCSLSFLWKKPHLKK